MRIGIIGGSGLEKGDVLQNLEKIKVETPYGEVRLKSGKLGEHEIFIISRHGENHEITPTLVNNRANIYALGKLECKHVLATTACGSLQERMKPGDFVIVNQFIDFTKHREITFFKTFKDGIQHTSMANPFSSFLRDKIIQSCEELNLECHKIGTIITIEGPRFSTRAESFMFKRLGGHVINMSTAPEAILANEAGLEYAVIAMITDYDCWKKTEAPVTWEIIENRMKENSEKVKHLLIKTIENLSKPAIKKEIILEMPKQVDDFDFIKSKIRTIPNFPKQGIMFRDITTLLQDREGFDKTIKVLVNRYKDKGIDIIAGIESRGFIIGSILASRLGVGFVPIRKPGKLPSETIKQEYELEYGTDAVEIHKDAIQLGERVLLVDDLLATGGTALASCKLIEFLGGKIVECAFVIELPELKGREKLEETGKRVFSIIEFEGE